MSVNSFYHYISYYIIFII